jgi:hypothetical protein
MKGIHDDQSMTIQEFQHYVEFQFIEAMKMKLHDSIRMNREFNLKEIDESN